MSRTNQGYDFREAVPVRWHGSTLLDYLTDRFRHTNRANWSCRIAAGELLVDDRPAVEAVVLDPGAVVTWRRPGWVEPPAPVTLSTVYRDRELHVVCKPSGLPTLPGSEFLEHTLLNRLRALDPLASPAHRLGRFTSGLVVSTRCAQARRRLLASWNTPAVRKTYRALIVGRPAQERFRIDVPIGKIPYRPLGELWAAKEDGKPSRSHVRLLDSDGESSLVEVRIETGRPHQIRIHLAAVGHPLVGDPLFGPGGRPIQGTRAIPGDPGYLLHAWRIDLAHPADGRRLELRSIPPSPALRRRGQPVATGGPEAPGSPSAVNSS